MAEDDDYDKARRELDEVPTTPSAIAEAVTLVHAVLTAAGRPRSRGTYPDATPEQLLAALTVLRHLREQLTSWEPDLITAARTLGVSWASLAPALGVTSRQAAERRYLRLSPQPDDQPATTREQRVDATRDQRSGDRAVARWARDNAAALRQLAGQITALDGLDPSAGESLDRIRIALGADAADLIGPLSDIGPPLSVSHPALADKVTALNQATDRIRTADRDRRNSPKRRQPADG